MERNIEKELTLTLPAKIWGLIFNLMGYDPEGVNLSNRRAGEIRVYWDRMTNLISQNPDAFPGGIDEIGEGHVEWYDGYWNDGESV